MMPSAERLSSLPSYSLRMLTVSSRTSTPSSARRSKAYSSGSLFDNLRANQRGVAGVAAGCWAAGRAAPEAAAGRARGSQRPFHHAHFSRAALADRGTQPGVRYADAIDQLTSQATSLANWNHRTVRLLKWDVRHTLC